MLASESLAIFLKERHQTVEQRPAHGFTIGSAKARHVCLDEVWLSGVHVVACTEEAWPASRFRDGFCDAPQGYRSAGPGIHRTCKIAAGLEGNLPGEVINVDIVARQSPVFHFDRLPIASSVNKVRQEPSGAVTGSVYEEYARPRRITHA